MMKKRKSTSNVFRDLGFNPEEAANLKVRARLMVEVEKYIRARHLTQKEAAARLGVTQPRISDLMRGESGLFSVDTLITMLIHAGLMVDCAGEAFRRSLIGSGSKGKGGSPRREAPSTAVRG